MNQKSRELSPLTLDHFIGQFTVKRHLRVYIDAAKARKEMMDHTLLYGPPGLGKTTLARVLAAEMGLAIRTVAAPTITKVADIASLLTNMETHEVLFIDEIHRLSSAVEEMLYSAMDDCQVNIIVGEGVSARVMNLVIPAFTLVGATTRLGQLKKPFRDRFGIHCPMQFYSVPELESILKDAALKLALELTDDSVRVIAERGRGTPRVVLRLLRRLRDFAEVKQYGTIHRQLCEETLQDLGIDALGLDRHDRSYLRFLSENYRQTCVGIHTIAAALSERRETIEDMIEPYLMQIGFLKRTNQGRKITEKALCYLTALPSFP